VKQSGGSVFVASEVNVGTRFTIFLPASHGDVVSIEPAPVEHGKAGSETILLVEDDAQVRRLAREVFARQGYRVLEADCGSKALEIVAGSGEPIDLLVTDIVMPRISGQQLAAQLTERQPSLKVLFMSGYSDEAIKHHGILAPGTGLLTKPFTPESLIAQARGLLDRA
jgi:CheY-like chemotaxis protein